METNQLKEELRQFTGTEEYHRMHGLLLTDGVKFMAERAGAFWLLDVIWSYLTTNQEIRAHNFLACKLFVKKNRARFVIGDGNNVVLVKQVIEFTDFPLKKITLFVQPYGSSNHVVMLPSEY